MKRLLHFTLPFFLDPDTGGGSGGASTAAPPAGGAADSAASELANYEPPAIDDVTDFIAGDTDEVRMPEKKDPPAKADDPAAKKADDDKAAKEKAEVEKKSAADPKAEPDKKPAKLLREQLEKVSAEKAELEKKLEAAKTDKRVDELTAQIAEKEKAIEAKGKALEDAERKLLVHNPLVSKRLKDLASDFNGKFAQHAENVPGLKGQYAGLLDAYAAVTAVPEAEYAEALKEFKGKLREQFEEDAPEVLAALREGIAFRKDHARAVEEVQRDAVKIDYEARKSEWEAGHKRFETEYEKWLEPPADAATSDPLNHKLFLKNFEEAMPKEEVAKVDRNVKIFLDRLFNGAQPRSKEDFPGMPDDKIAAEMQRIEGAVKQDREMAPKLIAVGLKLAAYFRPIIADYQRLKKLEAGKRDAEPPDATKGEARVAKKEGDEIESPDAVAAGMFE